MTDDAINSRALLAGKTALLVEDQPIIREMVTKLLTRFGFSRVEEAPDGSDALRILDRQGFDIIICDINMKPMDGLDFVRRLRAGVNLRYDRRRANTPVILLTGSSEAEHVYNAKGLGVRGYLLKPIDAAKLEDRLVKIFTA